MPTAKERYCTKALIEHPNAGKHVMKAHEVLKRYEAGRRDFSGENLRGQSFKGKDLSGANFSEADIRGANFTNAKLTGANFTGAKAGLQHRWAMGLVIASWILSAITGVFSIWLGLVAALIFNKDITGVIAGWIALIMLAIFCIVTIRKGLVAGFGAGAGAGAFAVAVAGAVAVPVAVAGAVGGAGAFAGAFAVAVAGAFAVAVAGAFAGAFAVAVAGAFAVAGAVAGAFAVAGAVAGAFAVAVAVAVAVAFAGAVALFSAYIGWRALKGDERDAWIRTFAIAFAATGGTSFRNADLTEADFTSATLKSTDFRNATLTRTNLHHTKKLDRARVGNTILIDTKVQDLVVTHRGAKQSYVGCNLKGANLTSADLNDADLTEADISGANLQEAWLERANLTKTQALNTNFNQAHLTGACLEAWNIDSTTQLEQVYCRYVYLLEHPDPKTGSRERRPHDPDKLFEPGDFEKLYKKVMNTVQILLRDGINQQAFRTAFQKIMEENPGITLDSIQAIEKKGNDVLLTLEVPEDTDKGKFEHQFLEAYQARLEAQKQSELLEAETRHSRDIKEITIAALMNNPSFNLTNEVKTENKAMSDSTDQSRKIENRDGSVTGNILGDSGTISGTVAETINQLPTSNEPGKPGIKELLSQLQAAINDPNLPDDDKTQALEQIKVLAEAGQNPNNETAQKQAKKAMGFLKVIAEGVPSAAKLVEAWKELLPAIAHFFGL